MKRSKLAIVLSFLLLCFPSLIVWGAQNLKIVTDPWPPYAYEENGQIVGTDLDVAMAVLERMGVNAEIELLPWKRCLALVETKQADAILAASITEERKRFLHYPIAPISEGVTVFFKKKGSQISSIDLDNTKGHKLGAMLGYKYCDELDQSSLVQSASRLSSQEQNFKKLLLGRIDLVIAVESVGFYKASKMGISDQVEAVSNARYCHGGNYLAFSKKEGLDKLSEQFGKELLLFKQTSEYQKILERYGAPSSLDIPPN